MAKHVDLILQILEGTNFHHLDHDSSLVFKGNVDRVILSSDPIPLSSISGLRLEIGEEMIWKMSPRNFKRIKMMKALKLECFNLTASGATVNLGYIILTLKSVTGSNKSTLGWRRLLGNNLSSHKCPQLHIAMYVRDEGTDTQGALSPPSDNLDITKSEPQLVVKNGMTYIGPERFSTKRFQLTCTLHSASNLDLLVSRESTPRYKKFHLKVLVLGQALMSSSFGYPTSHTDFDQTFVFDVMSSEDMLSEYLRENPSIELELLSEDVYLHGSCKQYIDSLQPSKKIQLKCFMDKLNSQTRSTNVLHPSVELSLSLLALDNSGNCSNKNATPVTEEVPDVNDYQTGSNGDIQQKHDDVVVPQVHATNKPVELIDLTSDTNEHENEETSQTQKIILECSESAKNSETNPETIKHLEKEEVDIEIINEVMVLSRTKQTEGVVPKSSGNSRNLPEKTAHQEPFSSTTKPVDPRLKLNLTDLKFAENQYPGNYSERLSNSELLAKVVEELEDWKFKEKILFAEDLKQQKDRLIARWEAEQQTRAEEHERTRAEVLKHTRHLATQLEQELQTLQHKEEELISEQEKFKNLTKTLQEKYARKVKSHQMQYQEVKTKLEAVTQRHKQLQQQMEIVQHENQRLTSKAQGSESSQLAKLKEQVRELEKQVLHTQQDKAALVRKWIMSQQELTRMQKNANSENGSTNHQTVNYKHSLQETLEEEKNQLLSERARLEQLRLELDGLGLMCSPDTEVAPESVPGPAKVISAAKSDSASSQLRRMQHEREELVNTGLYTPQHDLIQTLDQAIHQEMQS